MTRHKTRILVTGIQGQVGFELVKSLGSSGAELILACRKPQSIERLGYPSIALDLGDKSQISQVLNDVRPDIIINPAAYTAVDKAESEKAQANAINCDAVGEMADYLRKTNGAMIHFSTDYVYNPAHSQFNSENDATSPVNMYAESKLNGERLLQESGIPHVILRTSWVYGINGNNFVKTMLKLGRERETLRIVSDQVGSPTSATTLAQAVASILVLGNHDPVGFLKDKKGIYNLSDSGITTWLEFAQEIFRQAESLGIELKVKDVEGIKTSEYPTPAHRPLNSRLSLQKIGNDLHVFPPTWQQSLGVFLHQSHIKLF